ncbi:hypothetical protein B0J12DRAFT_379634 [Macrophomina phaseolina]|uniref:Uncharacterized protein n=1 Tax=Macrophomina phaseolina TaxID=35725 RepID=A0ABQ8GN84_9PEZI|nr:hypothetical protein B0J12DRAFT_379634 [Macrophomina phaseolina]
MIDGLPASSALTRAYTVTPQSRSKRKEAPDRRPLPNRRSRRRQVDHQRAPLFTPCPKWPSHVDAERDGTDTAKCVVEWGRCGRTGAEIKRGWCGDSIVTRGRDTRRARARDEIAPGEGDVVAARSLLQQQQGQNRRAYSFLASWANGPSESMERWSRIACACSGQDGRCRERPREKFVVTGSGEGAFQSVCDPVIGVLGKGEEWCK